jgi:hypothetical protein
MPSRALAHALPGAAAGAGFGHPPELSAEDNVTPVRNYGMLKTQHALYLARTDFAPVSSAH